VRGTTYGGEMSNSFDSVYPDFLRVGLGKLSTLGGPHELLSLFTALEHFRRDLHAQDTVEGILQVSRRYIDGLNLFRATAFHLVNPKDFGFESVLCEPVEERERLDAAIRREIEAGRFARALRQSSPVFFHAGPGREQGRGLLHSLALSSQVLGMFSGLLRDEAAPVQEIAFSLLSLLLGESADALATLKKTAELRSQIKTLSGLLPICAWCKKVRDDRGYWEQIESYVRSRTDASFSHGICPDCAKKMMQGLTG
jgi:hypothetical protein